MGIPGFYRKYLTQQVTRALANRLPANVASLAFDLNGVFHDARNRLFGSKDPRIKAALATTSLEQLKLEMFNTIATIILDAVEAVNPQDCLILAVDGVAPGGKMQQQKGRRERAAREREPDSIFDGNAITPGTEFMRDLDAYLLRFIGTQRAHLPPKVLYSSHLVPGEGEHKIMDFYRAGEVSTGSAAQNGGVHVLRGLDADLIMLSLISPVEHIYLSRESESDVINIDEFKSYLLDRSHRASAIDDFVVMMFLLGNDFLPKSPSLEEMSETIQFLIDTYADGDYTLTYLDDDGMPQIAWEGLIAFVQTISKEESRFLATAAGRPVKFPSRFLETAMIEGKFYPAVFRSAWYKNALGPKGSTEFTEILNAIVDRYEPTTEDLLIYPVKAVQSVDLNRIQPEQIGQMCQAYLRTLAWVYLYYKRGTAAINQDWLYPYYHTPLLIDLAAEIVNLTRDYPVRGYAAHAQMINFTALHQLVAVLPLKSKDLLPIELQPLFESNSPIRDLFPSDFRIELDGKHQEYEGVPIVPLVDRRRIIDAVGMIYIGAARARLWLPAQTELFTATTKESRQYEQQSAARRQKMLFQANIAGNRRGFDGTRGGWGTFESTRGGRGTFESTRGGRGTFESTRGGRGTFEGNRSGRGTFESTRGGRGTFEGNRSDRGTFEGTRVEYNRPPRSPQFQNAVRTEFKPRRSPPVGSLTSRGAPLITRGGTLITRAPTTPLKTQPGVPARAGPSLTPLGTSLPPGVSVGRGTRGGVGSRGGPSLTPLGTNLLLGTSGARGGPSLTPLGTSLPPGVSVGRGSRPTQPKKSPRQFPPPGGVQWQEMEPLL